MVDANNIMIARSKATANKFIKEDIKRVYHNIYEAYNTYYQSYLKWMYKQNPKFAENLTLEENVNYFLQELNHPFWFRVRLKESSMDVQTQVTEYFKEYSKDANQFDYRIPVFPKGDAPYHGVEIEEEVVPAPENIREMVQNIAKQNRLRIDQSEVNSMDYWTGVYNIAALRYKVVIKQIKAADGK